MTGSQAGMTNVSSWQGLQCMTSTCDVLARYFKYVCLKFQSFSRERRHSNAPEFTKRRYNNHVSPTPSDQRHLPLWPTPGIMTANELVQTDGPHFHLFASHQDTLTASSVTFISLSTIFVLLRFVSRQLSKAGIWVGAPIHSGRKTALRPYSGTTFWSPQLWCVVASIYDWKLTESSSASLLRPSDYYTCLWVKNQVKIGHANSLKAIDKGFGKHIYILPLDTTSEFLERLWIFELIFGLTICLNKFSM